MTPGDDRTSRDGPHTAGRFLCGALDEFVRVDPGRRVLDEARELAAAGRNAEAYRLLSDGLRSLGKWRADATTALVRIALRGRRPLPVLSDDFAELVRIARGSGDSLLPVLELFELAGHEERKELLFDHATAAADPVTGDVVALERMTAAARRGQWSAAVPTLASLAGKARLRCFAWWEAFRILVAAEREPWSTAQLDTAASLPEWLTALLGPMLALKVLRATALRPGAALRLPRPGDQQAGELRTRLEATCRPGCPVRELTSAWADASLLLAGRKSALPQAELLARVTALSHGLAGPASSGMEAGAAPRAEACRLLPREPFLRKRLEAGMKELADTLAADLGAAPARAGGADGDLRPVASGMLRGRTARVAGFLIEADPVTRIRYAEFDPGTVLRSGEEHHPMTQVNWFQARAFARRQGGRLPAVCEWWWALKSGVITAPPPPPTGDAAGDDGGSAIRLPRAGDSTVDGSDGVGTTGAGLPEAGSPMQEWSEDWMLAGAEKVRMSVDPSGGAPVETGLPAGERDPRLGFRVVVP